MFPYNRVIQWAAGPVAALVALGVAYLAKHSVLVADHQEVWVSNATTGAMFVVTAIVTYAAHHKWLDNQKVLGIPVGDAANVLLDEANVPSDVPGIDEVPVPADGSPGSVQLSLSE